MGRIFLAVLFLGFIGSSTALAQKCTQTIQYKHSGVISCPSSTAVAMQLPAGFTFESSYDYALAYRGRSYAVTYGVRTIAKPYGVCTMNATSASQAPVIIRGAKTAVCPSTVKGYLRATGEHAGKFRNCTSLGFDFQLTNTVNGSTYKSCQYARITGSQKQCLWEGFWIYPDWVTRTVTLRRGQNTFDYFEKSGVRCAN